MEYEKYIVPIFTSDESKTTPSENDFNGNGVIIGKHFITAAHVVKRDKTTDQLFTNVWFKFEEQFYKLTEPIYIRYAEDTQMMEANKVRTFDLAIYDINEFVNSPIEYADEQDDYLNCSYYGYSMNEKTKQLSYDVVDTMKIYTKVVDNRNSRPPYYIDNCYEFCPEKELKHGNSGGAMFQGNKFVGLFVSIPLNKENKPIIYRSRCISAKYISEIINSL